jgi:hypothetical protein
MNPITVALVYAVVGFLGMPIGFKLFKTPFDWIDIALASVGGALASLIPTIGGPVSYVIVVAILYWRIGKEALTDILISVAVSRLAMLPVLLLIAKPH